MAHAVQFSKDYNWTAPVPIRSFEVNVALMRWFFTHAQVGGGWVKLDFLSKSDAELGELVRAVPDFGEARRDFRSFRVLLAHLGTPHRFTDEQVGQIGELITGWNGQAVTVLKTYSPEAPAAAKSYELLTKWAHKTELVLQYLMRKVSFSCSIIDSYGIFRGHVDALQPLMNQMIVGRTTKIACQKAGETALDSQAVCLGAITQYFATVPPWDDDPTLQNLLQTLVPGLTVGERSIGQLKLAKAGRTLHKRIAHDSPPSFAEWEEYGTASRLVDEYFKFLLATPVDYQSQSISKLPLKKSEVGIMKTRVGKLEDDLFVSPEEVSILLDDLVLLSSSINQMYEQSIPWSTENFGCTREELNEWRKTALIYKKTTERRIKKLSEEEKAKSDIYSKNLKSRKLPTISEANWSKFLALWKSESENYPTDEQKLSVLRDRLENQTDKSCTESMMTLEDLLSYLYKRYGSPNSIMQDNLDSLEHLGNPANDQKLEEHMVQISALLSICDKDPELSTLWTSARVGRVVNKCLSEAIRITFWECYERFKSSCLEERISGGLATPTDQWEAIFDKNFSNHRITFFLNFLELRLSILRNMGVGTSKRKDKNNVKNNLIGPEGWKCPVCSTKHPSDKKPCRPYLSCCEAFRKMGVEQMINTCRKYKYCQTCTSSLDDRGHKESTSGCPRKEIFKCRQCPVPHAYGHCDLLCKNQAKARKTGNGQPPKNGGGGHPPRGGGGAGGQPPRDGGGHGTNGGNGAGGGHGGCSGSCPNTSIVPFQSQNQSYGAKTWAIKEVCLKTQGDGSQEEWKMQGWLLFRNYFQPVLVLSIITGGSSGTVHCLTLSDSGSSIAFADEEFMCEIGIRPSGQWDGIIETINSTAEVSTPFYKITIKLERGTYTLFALSTKGLGHREEIPQGIVGDVGRMFRCDPANICRAGGPIRLLLGQDSGSLLLRPLTHLNGKEIDKYLPALAKDLSLQRSPVSPMLSVCGSVGLGDPMGPKTSIYFNKIPRQHYNFYSDPSAVDIQSLMSSHSKATFSVLLTDVTKAPAPARKDPPDGGSGGGSPSGPSPSPATPHSSPQVSQPNGQGTQKQNFSIQKLAARTRKTLKKSLPSKFPSIASLFVTLSLILRPVETTSPENFLPQNARRWTASHTLESEGSSPAWQPSNTTSSMLLKKKSKMFGIAALTTAVQLLADPDFAHKCNSLLAPDDPDSKAMFSLQLCEACAERSRRCQGCKWLNSHYSMLELEELELIRKCVSIKKDPHNPGKEIVEASYPFIGNLETLYSPKKSNYQGAVSTTRTLFRRLHKIGKAGEFHAEIEKSIRENHMRILSPKERDKVLNEFHCFSFLNYQLKESSESHKIRPVTNSSSSHASGSANSRTPRGPNMLANLRLVLENFRLKKKVAVSDLSRCYRCMYTDHKSNVMRLMAYPRNPLDPNNTEFDILYLERCTYGDQICSCLLEVILREIVSPRCKSSLARKILEEERYVDDLLGGAEKEEELTQAMQDIRDTLGQLGFSFKHLITNYHKFLPDGSSEDGSITPEMTIECVFHHDWNFRLDTLANKPKFNIHKKVRGAYAGPGLSDTNVDEVIVTKRLASRLKGQAFDIDGTFLAPLKAILSIFFSRICTVTDKWDEAIDTIDVELTFEFKTFLKVLQEKLPLVTPSSRCVIPPNASPIAIHGQSDGSAFLSSWVFYLISSSSHFDSSSPEKYSNITNAGQKIKHHSVPGNECMGFYLLMEGLSAYLFNHHSSIFANQTDEFPIKLGMDSECVLYSLNPFKMNKSVLVKNAVRAIHSFLLDLSTKFPQILFVIYHTISEENCSDLNSKVPADFDACRVMQSHMWRHGLPGFLSESFPSEAKVFLKVKNGQMTWQAPARVNWTCACSICHYSPGIYRMYNNQNIVIDWTAILDSLPLLTRAHASSLLTRRNLKMAVRSLARYLSLCLPQNVLEMVNVPRKWYEIHRLKSELLLDYSEIYGNEINTLFTKMAFLTLVKFSNHNFPPNSTGFQHENIAGIFFVKTRYSREGMRKVFQTDLLPLVSGKDRDLLYRAFQNAHVVKNPAQQLENNTTAHLSVSLTVQLMRTGFSALVSGKLRTMVASWVSKCPHCIRVGGIYRSFTHAAQDPRILSLVGVENPIYQVVSLDLFCDVYVLAHKRARGKPSYGVNILIAGDLISKSVSFVVLDGAKSHDICQGIQQLALKHRLPRIILVDSGPQLKNLGDHEELTQALSLDGIKIIAVPQGHQMANHVERLIGEAKKVLNSLREDTNSSLYRQPQTLLELIGKLNLVESVMSMRPILAHTKDQHEVILTPRRLTHPYLSGEQLNQSVVDILRGVFDPDPIVSQLGRTAHENKVWLQESLIQYLQDSAIRFQSERKGNKQKPAHYELKPKKDDIVFFLDSENRKRFGIILEICELNQVVVRSVLYNKVVERKMHIRVLTLLYRPEEWSGDFPLN